MVHAGLPEHILFQHAVEAHEDVLDRVVQRVAHVQRPGDIGRRNDDGEGLGAGRGPCPGGKGIGLESIGIDAGLDGAGLIGLFKHWSLATAATRQGPFSREKDLTGRIDRLADFKQMRDARSTGSAFGARHDCGRDRAMRWIVTHGLTRRRLTYPAFSK